MGLVPNDPLDEFDENPSEEDEPVVKANTWFADEELAVFFFFRDEAKQLAAVSRMTKSKGVVAVKSIFLLYWLQQKHHHAL